MSYVCTPLPKKPNELPDSFRESDYKKAANILASLIHEHQLGHVYTEATELGGLVIILHKRLVDCNKDELRELTQSMNKLPEGYCSLLMRMFNKMKEPETAYVFEFTF